MDFFEAQDFFKGMYPGKKIDYSFDENCHRFYELVLTEGKPNLVHHVESHKVKVSVEGLVPFYVPISPHREAYSWSAVRDMIMGKKDVYINQSEIDQYNDLDDSSKKDVIKRFAEMSGLSESEIQKKLS